MRPRCVRSWPSPIRYEEVITRPSLYRSGSTSTRVACFCVLSMAMNSEISESRKEKCSSYQACLPRSQVPVAYWSTITANTPHNPVGKVFSRAELEKIAALAQEFNLVVISDEVVSRSASNIPRIIRLTERSRALSVRHPRLRRQRACPLRDSSRNVGAHRNSGVRWQ